MNRYIRLMLMAAATASLAACTTVPDITLLHADDVPQVGSIIDEIACEISTSDDHLELRDQKYLITVLLTLQVDDQMDLTPSLSWINPLEKTYSFLALANADLGGQRERTFTTTYTMDAADLMNSTHDCSGAYRKKRYNLSGNLGINNIIADGMQVFAKSDGIRENPAKDDDKTAPSFGSKIQFIVTQSVTALGPTWTLKYFKGPSGSNGLLSGKRVTTDSVLITFTPLLKVVSTATVTKKKKVVKAAQAKLASSTDQVNQKRSQLSATVGSLVDTQKVQAELGVLTDAQRKDQTAFDAAVADSAATEAAQKAGGVEIPRANGVQTSDTLIQNMLLNGIITGPR